jgi:glc operon protein GlcG
MYIFKSTVAAVALLSIAPLAQAQFAETKSLTMDGARRVITAAVAEASNKKTTGVIAVVDNGGNLMALERIDGTFAAGANISIGKARTALLFQKPTKVFEDIVNKGRTAMVALDGFTPLQGGVPITVDGQIVGAVGVSGAASAQQDEELAMAGAKAFESGPPPVSYFPKDQVKAAFAKGSVLFDHSDKYMVHASRREQSGMSEIHTKDADIVYVLDGTATLVTGGTAVNSKPIAADEFRGERIDGGETRQLAKGDVIIIPAGVPHWFKEVTNPFLYYVVKAR